MKSLQLFFVLAVLSASTINSFAQQSCSFIIHIDGSNGIDNVTCGEEGTPCASINYGIGRAVAESYSDVRIAANTNYQEIVEVVSGVNLWGGI